MRPSLEQRLQSEGILDEMVRLALDAYPDEGCGFVFETSTGELVVIATGNTTSPGDAQSRFEANMTPWLIAERDGAKPQLVFHSHPDGAAEMSTRDVRLALFEEAATGEMKELHPGLAHVVMAVDGSSKTERQARMFRFSKADGCFVEVAVFGGFSEE